MNMRWAWTLPVLSSLAALGITAQLPAQGDPAQAQFYGQPMVPGLAAPSMMAPGGMYPQMAMHPQMAMMGGVQPMAYMGGPTPAAPMGMPGAMPGMMPGGPMPGGPMPGGMPGPMPMGPPDAYGGYGSMPTDMGVEAGMGPMGPMGGGGNGCPYCNGGGCDFCNGMGGHHGHRWIGGGLLGDILHCIMPYPDGGCASVRWYDFAVDFMSLKRDDPGITIPLTTQGINGPVVLSTDDLDFEYVESFRFSAGMQVGPGSSLEFTYFGLFDSNASAVARSANNDLFSIVSNFGLLPDGGFPETDASNLQRIDYNSTFDSFEVSWRRRWMGPNCRYQGSWMAGVRHFILDENFRLYTQSPLSVNFNNQWATAHFRTDTTNNLTGFQFGGDMWICVMPGLRVGVDGRAGVYGNHANVNTTIFTNTGFGPFFEEIKSDDVAFIGQLELMFTYRINYQWTARAGYQLLYLDGVALGTDNFNRIPPFGPQARTTFINDDGNVFYHGYNIGLEFQW
jgi:hypothetical protein